MGAGANGSISAALGAVAVLLTVASLSACAGIQDPYAVATRNYFACKTGLQQATPRASPAFLDRTVGFCEASLQGAEFTDAPRMAAQAHIARDRVQGTDHHPEIVRLLALGVDRARTGAKPDWWSMTATCDLLRAEGRPGDPECGQELLRQAAREKARLAALSRYYSSLPYTPRRSEEEEDSNRMMREGYEFMRMQQETYERR